MFTVAICLFFRKTKLSVLVACNKLQTESTNAAAIYKTKDFPSTIANNLFDKLQKCSSSFGIRLLSIQYIKREHMQFKQIHRGFKGNFGNIILFLIFLLISYLGMHSYSISSFFIKFINGL